ncbi:MAG: membrane protein insertion efficiency factor YidD [Bacteroidales bacterium]|nr:membrane protein insertion efficiency factor YidD [Bacteroidales bacterium]
MNKRIYVIGFLIILNLIFVSALNGQPLADQELKTLFTSDDTEYGDYTKPLRESENEIDITVSVVFLSYKTFFSSQDMPTCIFTPSCSEYALEAFQKKGLLIGWLSTFDRLSRCHGLVKPDHYPFDFEKRRFYDPVQ